MGGKVMEGYEGGEGGREEGRVWGVDRAGFVT